MAISAKKPDWVENNGFSQDYPENQYVVGFGLATGDVVVRKQIAEQNAKTDLSSRFITKIRSELISKEMESDQDYNSLLVSTINSQTQLTLIGSQIEFYEDNKITYALAMLKIAPAITNYQKYIGELSNKINEYLVSAEKSEKNGDLKTALNLYRKTYPLFFELDETHTILNLLQHKNPFSDLKDIGQQVLISQADVERRIQFLIKENIVSIPSAAVSLAEQLSEQIANPKQLLLVYPLTFQDTEFGSEFSAYFQDEMSRELTGKFTVLTEDSPNAANAARLTGNYRIDGNICRIQIVITNSHSGEKLSAASVSFDKSVVENHGIALMPRNWQQAMEDGRVFYAKDVVSGKLSLEAWTNKGNKNLIFRENDESTLIVRVNKPCYIQVLYHLADGLRVLMYNNYYIDISKVNMIVAMPDTFVVCAPFGVERWQVFASTEKFPDVPVKSEYIDGELYEDILAEDLEKFTVSTRGMKKKQPQLQMSETTITLTTIQR